MYRVLIPCVLGASLAATALFAGSVPNATSGTKSGPAFGVAGASQLLKCQTEQGQLHVVSLRTGQIVVLAKDPTITRVSIMVHDRTTDLRGFEAHVLTTQEAALMSHPAARLLVEHVSGEARHLPLSGAKAALVHRAGHGQNQVFLHRFAVEDERNTGDRSILVPRAKPQSVMAEHAQGGSNFLPTSGMCKSAL